MSEFRIAEESDVDTVVEILVAAFHDDPISGWAFPGDERRRRESHPAFFSTVVRTAGRIDIAEDNSAAMVWSPGPEEGDDEGFPGLGPVETERLEVLFGLMGEHAPTGPPHWHAQFLGVVPGRQREGVGGRLFRHGLQRYDAEGMPTYLEASSPESARLYRRLGYRDFCPAFTPPGGPPMQPMWRDPA
jgi:GNAT superfamily N-acetyltransferase